MQKKDIKTTNNDIENIITITGAARSGTSMVAGIVSLCGAFGGVLAGPNKYNRKGMFENSAVRDTIVKPFLRDVLHVDPLGQRPLPDMDQCWRVAGEMASGWKTSVRGVMIDQGYLGGPLFLKCAKMCLIWPIWAAAFPSAKWIIVRRNPQDIAASCLRTPFMRAFKTTEGWLGWVAEHEKRFEEMHTAGLAAREIWSQKIVEGNLDWISAAVEWAGLKWNEAAVHKFIDPGLWKGNAR